MFTPTDTPQPEQLMFPLDTLSAVSGCVVGEDTTAVKPERKARRLPPGYLGWNPRRALALPAATVGTNDEGRPGRRPGSVTTPLSAAAGRPRC